MVNELIEIDDEIYKQLETASKTLGVSLKELLKICVNGFGVISSLILKEAEILKERLGVSDHELAELAVLRVTFLSAGLYGLISALDEVLGVWGKGFLTSHGSGKIVDESGNIRGVFLHLDSSEASLNKSIVDCVELLFHEGGLVVGFHSTYGFEGFSSDELGSIKNKIEGLMKGLRDSFLKRLSMCSDSNEVEVEVEDHGSSIIVSIVVYSKKFSCIPHIDIVNAELAKVIVGSGLAEYLPDNRRSLVNEFINKC
ncbi:MAG: hypothetical protein QXO98_04900 [Sulfolobales archaeon]